MDVLQPCVTFNKTNTYQFYRQYVYKLGEDYQTNDKIKAYEKAMEWESTGKIPIGIFYEENKATYEEDIEQIKTIPLADQELQTFDVNTLTEEFI